MNDESIFFYVEMTFSYVNHKIYLKKELKKQILWNSIKKILFSQ